MIELTEHQAETVAQSELPSLVIDPRTREEFILLPKRRFDAMQKWMSSLKRKWDDPADDDLIKKP